MCSDTKSESRLLFSQKPCLSLEIHIRTKNLQDVLKKCARGKTNEHSSKTKKEQVD